MNIGLKFRQEMQAAVSAVSGPMATFAQSVLANFQSLYTGLQTWFQVEHNEDGTHGAVTATSATISGLLQIDRFRHKKILVWDYNADNSGVIKGAMGGVNVVDASVIMFVDTTPGAGGIGRTIHSLDSTGRTTGEVVWLVHADDNGAAAGLGIRLQSASAGTFTRFRGDPAIAATISTRLNSIVPIMFVDKRDLGPYASSTSFWWVGQV